MRLSKEVKEFRVQCKAAEEISTILYNNFQYPMSNDAHYGLQYRPSPWSLVGYASCASIAIKHSLIFKLLLISCMLFFLQLNAQPIVSGRLMMIM